VILSFFVWFSQPSKPKPSVKVGIFYYLWYGAPNSDGWNASKFVDFPLIGNYSSSNSTVIGEQLREIKGLGVDFVVLSWWGFYDNYGKFIDGATKQVFQVAESQGVNLKFALMIEPFNSLVNRSGQAYDYNAMYDHVYNDFVVPFPTLYYSNNEPLICFFNDQDLTKNRTVPIDVRFNSVIIGQSDYCQWIYTNLNCYDKPKQNSANEVSITPRYDDSRIRTPNCTVDFDLSQGIYDQEWKNAIELLKEGKIDTVMITSWNEYPERTAIEPHHDATAFNSDPWFLYNKTRDYIQEVRLLAK
jgi:hypothetical protein